MNLQLALCTLLLCLCIGCTHRQKDTIGIIGSADGPTAIFVADNAASFLQAQGLHLTQQMRQLANDSSYIANAVYSKKVKALIKDIGSKEYHQPQKIFCVSHLDMQVTKFLLSQSGATKPLIIDRIIRSIPTLLNAQGGADNLAATSLLFAEDAFLYPALKEYMLYLYLYEGNYHSIVLYRPGKQDIVLANASFVIHERLKTLKTPAEVKQFFAEILDMSEAKVTEEQLAE